MQEFKHSSAVVQSAEFIQFAVDDVDQNLRFMDALTHSMKWVILQTFYQVCPHSGESYSKLWKWMSCWPHLDLQFRYIFCGVRLTHRDTKYWSPRLHWPYCIIYWVESVLPTSFLVSKKQAVHRGSHPGQCAVYRMPRYTLTLEKHWSLRYCWALQYHVHLYVGSSLMVEVNYHHQE